MVSAAIDVLEVATGARLRYRRLGAGDPLVLLMGTAGSLGLWKPVEPEFAARFDMIEFDYRGLGGSERGRGQITTASLADDTLALLDALAVLRTHVLGWSLGGAVAQELALRHPTRVGCLVLFGTWSKADRFGIAILTGLRSAWALGDLATALTSLGIAYSPWAGRAVAGAIPGARFELLTGAGSSHAVLWERTPEVLGLILEFLSQHAL